MIQVFVMVTITFIAGAVVRHILDRLAKRAQKTRTRVDNVLFGSLLGPARTLVWIIGLSFAAQIIGMQTEEAQTKKICWHHRNGYLVPAALHQQLRNKLHRGKDQRRSKGR